ncbi:MAG: Ig-like domain repeat protein [Verrucomicrobiaceae bacterium]|nr:Ig-like domain repeat protein [Verrucomicrobiaceae bacterium]
MKSSLLSPILVWMLLAMAGLARAFSPNPDLTLAGAIATLKTDTNSSPLYTETYNLGPTGLRGWIYIGGGNGADGTITVQSRQILVTVASAPGNAVLAVDDVILGAMAGDSGTVPLFTSDARKAFGAAITESEKSGAGSLRVKRWRAGVTTDVNIPMTIMGDYTATAPYNCPKSALILANARNALVSQLLANSNFLTNDWAGAINGLALLAGVAPGDPNYTTVQTRLQTYARALAATTPNFAAVSTWSWGYIGVFLSEYYLSTGDANVVTGMNNYIVALAKVQSRYGTYGHAGSLRNADGSFHGTVGPYGPVNQAGLPAVIAIVLGKKALQAAGVSLDPEIDPAIQRGSDFFAWFVNKGPIPYGEHEPFMDGHSSNGKDPLCAVLFGLQATRTVETEYFARMSVAGFLGREYGHTGQGFSYLWGAMGAHMGGALALAEYMKPIRWHLDLERRTDGSFVYDGAEQYGAGKTADGTYLGTSGYYSMNPTATYILTYGLPLQRIHITGKSAIPANTLDAAKVSNAITAATFNLDAAGLTTTQLIAAVSEFDPVVRNYAAIELAKRTLTVAEVNTLLAMLTGANANGRMGACQVLGLLKNATALPLITQRLYDPDLWVRAKAASALRSYDAATASTQRDAMLAAFAANATNPDVIDWSDPIQICNGYLGFALFGDAVYGGTNIATYTINAPKNLLYPALKVGLKQPDSKARFGPAKFCNDRLTLADVQALIPDLVEVIESESQADTMWSMNPRGSGIATLAKYKIREGIPLALAMQEIPTGFGWNASGFQVPGLNALVAYGDASRWTLPTLRSYLGTWDPLSSQYTTLVNSIASIDNAITAPTQALGFAVANSQVVATTGARSITLSGASPRTAVTFGNVIAPLHGTLTGTAPNLIYTPDAGYTGPDFFTFQVMDDLTTSELGTVSIIVGTAGTGLKGEYFDNVDFTNLKLTRTDAQVNFDWGTGSPDASIGADTFSVRWSGLLLVPETASYTFSTLNSDGVRLYINGVLVIDDYADQATSWKDGTPVNLTAGQMVDVQLEYYENTGSAVAKLKWTGPSFAGANGLPIATEWLFDGSGVTNRTAYAHDQSVTMIQNTSQPVTLTGSGGTLTYSIVTPPANGTLSGTAPNLTYTPTTNFNGTDSFTFLVNNGTASSTPATVSIAIWAGTPVDFYWATAASANWSGATTWNNAAGATSVPNASGQPFYRMSVSKTGTYTATQDVSGGFVLNQLNVAGTVTLAGTNSFNFTANGPILPQFNQNSASAVTISAPLTLNAMTTFGGTSGGNVTISSVISGAGGFTKSNAGTLTLSNFTNTYTGGTVLNAGTVTFPAGSGSATPHFGTGPITVNSEATLHTNRSFFNNSVTLNSATVVTGNSFESLLAGPVTLNGITTFSFGTSGGFRITGNISGTGGFTTTGTTQWTLTGTNSYTGPTTIQAGTLRYSAAAAVGPGAISIATGGKANLNYTGTRFIASLTLGGVLQPAGTYGSNASSAANKSDTWFTSTGLGVLNVQLIPTTTAVTSSSTPAMTGSAVTFTATVTGGTPTGSVTFFDGPTAIGTSPLNASFQATLTRSTLTAGTHTLTAQYLGDPSHATSTSAGFSQVIVLSPFDSWTIAQGLTPAPLDDSDHDGVSNLLEYATKMNPAANDAVPQSAAKTGSNLEFTYTKNKSATDVTFTVEWSDDFTTWSTAGVTQALVPGSDNGVTEQWKATMPAGANGRRFVHLKVTRP